MFKSAIFFTAFLFITSIACKQSSKHKDAKSILAADTAKFYPLDNFIEDQMRYVDLRNYNIQKTISVDSSKSIKIIDKETFLIDAAKILSLAKNFIKNKQLYKEVVFQDLSTNSYTINYTAVNASTPLQRIDILLSEETKIIKRVLMREINKENGIVTTQQINWEADHQFQVNRSKEIEGKITKEVILISWNKDANK